MLIRITLAVEDPELLSALRDALARPDILVQVPKMHRDFWERILREPSDVLILSQSFLPTPLREKLAELQRQADSPAAVVLSKRVSPEEDARLMAVGFDAVLSAGLAVEQVRGVIEAMLEKRRRSSQKRFFAPQPLGEPRLADFVSRSPGMASFMEIVPRVVQSDTGLLIEGETGVGKERLACAIHSEGPRSPGRFVGLNCGALPEGLLESELFGHVRGAFTGATAARRGWFEMAHRGTLLLDEVGEIPLHLQVKLLRVLQEHEIQPVGSEKSLGVDVRVIAASNRPLDTEVESGRFRRDLYHRLSVVTVTIPPLRDRAEDIPELVERHIQFISRQMNRHVTSISGQSMNALCRYPWPGNVRELNNVLERAILLCDDAEITVRNLPESIAAAGRSDDPDAAVVGEMRRGASRGRDQGSGSRHRVHLPEHWLTMPLREVRKSFLSDLERQYLEGLLIANKGRIGEVANKAGIRERSLYDKMKQFDLRKEDFRSTPGESDDRDR